MEKFNFHGEMKTPCVYLSLKGSKSLRFSTPLSQDAAEREVWEPDKTFCTAQRCFLDLAEKIAGADDVPLAVLLA